LDARAITKALVGKWQGRYGLCRCPAHADKMPSMKVRDDQRKGDGIDVHCFAGCDWKDIKADLAKYGLLRSFETKSEPRRLPRTAEATSSGVIAPTKATGRQIWNESIPLPGTLGERYFTEYRGVQVGTVDHALRYNKLHRMVVALMTDPITGEPCGVHRTFLNADGSKRERKMLGRQGVVRVSPDEEVTHGLGIAEGVEDALAILASGWAPVWAATSAGMIERFPVLSGIECLTIFADNDAAGMAAAQACAERWADREVYIVGSYHEGLERCA
jgi:putative DNA primase/helicase